MKDLMAPVSWLLLSLCCLVFSAGASAQCVDDPGGMLAASGAPSCQILKSLGCDVDLHSMSPAAPVGSFVKVMCPAACGVCDGGGVVVAAKNGFSDWPVKVPSLSCDTNVPRTRVKVLEGAIPEWLPEGQLLHVAHTNTTWNVFGEVDTMGVTSLIISAPAWTSKRSSPEGSKTPSIEVSFAPLRGNSWQTACTTSEMASPYVSELCTALRRPADFAFMCSSYAPACAVSFVAIGNDVAVIPRPCAHVDVAWPWHATLA